MNAEEIVRTLKAIAKWYSMTDEEVMVINRAIQHIEAWQKVKNKVGEQDGQ